MQNTTDSQTIRSFIALELSDGAKEELSRITGILRESGANVKWMAAGSIHLTLKFLGNVSGEKIPAIADRLKEIASAARPFDITLSGIGVFPGWNYARVLWVGIGEGRDQTKGLAEQVEEAMEKEGFEKERRSFSPHLTLGRVRTSKNKNELKRSADSINVNPVSSHISRIVLFRSVLSREGARYEVLAAAEMTG